MSAKMIKIWERDDAKLIGFPHRWYGICPTQFWLNQHLEALVNGDELLSGIEVNNRYGIYCSDIRKAVQKGYIKAIQETWPKGGRRYSMLNVVRALELGLVKPKREPEFGYVRFTERTYNSIYQP
jgi:hypothetical protein